jgi:uncharacterized Zn finger protein
MKAKTANCENCSPESIFDPTTNFETDQPVWECRCCGKQISRRVLNTKSKQERKAKQEGFNKLFNELLGC